MRPRQGCLRTCSCYPSPPSPMRAGHIVVAEAGADAERHTLGSWPDSGLIVANAVGLG